MLRNEFRRYAFPLDTNVVTTYQGFSFKIDWLQQFSKSHQTTNYAEEDPDLSNHKKFSKNLIKKQNWQKCWVDIADVYGEHYQTDTLIIQHSLDRLSLRFGRLGWVGESLA